MENLITDINKINLSQIHKLINENMYIIEYYTEQLRQKDEIIKNTIILKNEEIQNLEKKNNNKKKKKKKRGVCAICFNNTSKILFFPCKHCQTCAECFKQYKKTCLENGQEKYNCIICRTEIDYYTEIYI